MADFAGRPERYYVSLGRAHDCLLRCKDCRALITYERITKLGSCECGNKRFLEITALNDAEQEQVKAMDFPDKEAFLAEFAPVEA